MSDHPSRPARTLVTGAAGALGQSVVRRFVAEGRPVLAVDVDEASLEDLVASAPEGAVAPRAADLTEADAVVELFDAAEARGGAPPAVAHLVGGFRYAPLAETSDSDWRFLWQLNVHSTFLVLREAARRFERAGGGALVAVSAPAALEGAAGVGAYGATKAAVLRLVESLAREMAGFGGRANAVLPGTMDTPANREAMPDTDPSEWASTDEVARVIHFLTTPAAAQVNGAGVRVPGPTLA